MDVLVQFALVMGVLVAPTAAILRAQARTLARIERVAEE